MTEPLTHEPHRPANAYPDLDPDFIGPPEPQRADEPAPHHFKLAVAKQVHDVVTTLLNATSMLEAIPEHAWDEAFSLIGKDLTDTAHAAAAQTRHAYEKALAVEVMVARAMR